MTTFPAIDAVCNLNTWEVAQHRPQWINDFHNRKFGRPVEELKRETLDDMLRLMDASGIEMAFLLAAKVGQLGLKGSWHIPMEEVARAVERHPTRFRGIMGIDPTEGMAGVRAFEGAVRNHGFVGAHLYPHWFEMAPDHARYYPYYAKCVELDVPIQMQVGQSMVYVADRPLRSVGRPITLDAVACDFPELKLIGIHIGIPWADEMIFVAYKHPNVHIGTDAHAPKYWPPSFVNFINTYGQDKVIYGTDYPALSFERTRREIDALGLRPEPYRKLMRDNAARLYRIAR
jgi:predicted TIM-barrel fold metal-dependent hydrolase